ncbi:MAG: insulinase family protein [Cyanothece sp. SIO2G6]|nr:insulinase family protein [Cyanothece sp. SIO2G6]
MEELEAGVNPNQLFWSARADSAEKVSDFLAGLMAWMVTGNLAEDDFDESLERLKEVVDRGLGRTDSIVLEDLLKSEDIRMEEFFASEDFEGLTFAGMKEWLDQTREDSYIEITVVGDVVPRTLIRDVRRTFGSTPTRTGKVFQPRHSGPAQWREPGFREGTLKSSSKTGYVTLVFPQVEDMACVADRRQDVFRPLLENHLQGALRDRPDWQSRLRVSTIGKNMVPRSNALRVQLRCEQDELESAKALLLDATAAFADSLTPEFVLAAERAAWIDLKRVTRSSESLLKLFSQSQGKPNQMRCVLELLEKGIEEDFETYKSVAAKQFSEENVRGAIARPKG